ncbi:DUF2637 domain-containing protein [Mycobacteroides abscessus]|uniref:DUF2637 domain-containing protein n=1 Tax=Mycobacteroides abscessus TaxID=36809 RepID=UPI000C25C178|nr:DUF2637 domain-containing protein [Mycobacteroides abscessus]
MITPALQAPLNATGPDSSSEGVDMHPWTRDLHVHTPDEGADESKPNRGSATNGATRTATAPATSAVAVDLPDRSAAPATVAVDQPEWPVAPFPQVTAYEEKSMTSTRTPAPAGWLRWKGLLALAATTSIGLNIWHAVETSGYGAAVLASIAPLYLFWIVHNLVTEPGGTRGWRKDKVGVSAAAVVALGAFAISYVTQRDLVLLLGMEEFVANILPLIVDLTIAVASYKLVHEAELATAAEQAPEQSVHQPVQTPVHRPEDAPAPAYPAGLTWLAPVHQPVHQPAETAPEPVEQAGAPAVTSDNEVVHRPGAPVHQEVVTQPVQAVEPPLLVPVHRADAPTPSEAVQTPVVQPVRQRTDPEPAQTPVVQPVHLEQAAAVVQSGGIELAVERVAEIFARKDSGQSQNEIANSKVAAKRTISKVLARREELEPAFA